jgi:hypothetical protein
MGAFTLPIIVDTLGKVKVGLTSGTNYTTSNRVLLKKNDTPVLAVQFVQNGLYAPFRLAVGSIVQVALKETGKYGAGLDYAATASTSIRPATDADPYLIPLPVSGAVIETLFGTAPTESAYVDLMFEVTWSEDGGATFTSTSDPIEARVYNDVIRALTPTPPIAPLLNVPQVYRDNGVIATSGGNLVKKYDLAAIFGLKAGDTAQFVIKSGAYIRAAYAANTPTVTDYSTTIQQYVTVDFSSPLNYDTTADLPIFSAPALWDEPFTSTPSAKWGTVASVISGGGLVTPNTVFRQAGAITATFTHTESVQAAPNDQAEINDVQCFVQIELLSVINSVID